MKRLKVLFGIHNHQPVGNFDHVFEELYQNCYRPYMEVLKDFPRLKTSAHFSGPLLEWLKKNHPDLPSAAVADFGRLRFSGFPAWVLWWAIHIAFLVGFRSRLLVMFGWGWAWLTFQRGARLITSGWQPSSTTHSAGNGSGARPPPAD